MLTFRCSAARPGGAAAVKVVKFVVRWVKICYAVQYLIFIIIPKGTSR